MAGDEAREETEQGIQDLFVWLNGVMAVDIETFDSIIQGEITKMRLSGMGEVAIAAALLDETLVGGRIFGALNNSLKSHLFGGIQAASEVGTTSVFNEAGVDTSRGIWKTFSVKPCESCQGRTDQVDTMENWISRGMPGTGWSLCKTSCNCRILPLGNPIPEGPVEVLD